MISFNVCRICGSNLAQDPITGAPLNVEGECCADEESCHYCGRDEEDEENAR